MIEKLGINGVSQLVEYTWVDTFRTVLVSLIGKKDCVFQQIREFEIAT
ncbi:hypothetical protein OAG56_05455 [Mariniblastus sp.]|nr:hypothetical protein [Mariniblastus sp.]MDB4756801.1 hypothetical protein [Mariniblastus sp.]